MIVRRPLRDSVYEELLRRIFDGRIAPGSRLRDTALAEALGVSRTPVREALLRLTREGIAEADAGYGFELRRLEVDEVRENYPILWTLEGLALRTSPLPPAADLRELARLNTRIGSGSPDPHQLLELDGQWHELLLARCPNRRLLELIRSMKDRVRRYEIAYMRGAGRIADSARQHGAVLVALRKGQVEAGARALEENWRAGMEVLLAWLAAPISAAKRSARAG